MKNGHFGQNKRLKVKDNVKVNVQSNFDIIVF
jgi:hypothetical protein